jgi:hypothetical protein
MTYHIFYGFVSGQAHGKEFRKLMRTAGFKLAKSAHKADIIIAHSAGCWRVRDDLAAKLVVFVGMPLQSGKAPRTFRRAVYGNRIDHRSQPRRGVRIMALNSWYALSQPVRNAKIIRYGDGYMEAPINTNSQALFIHNKHDPWPESPLLGEAIESLPYSFVSLPGGHINIWHHPEWYVDIIKQYAS